MQGSQDRPKSYKRDLRWPAAIFLTIVGAIIVLIVKATAGHGWVEFFINSAYSVGWTMITFGILYLLSSKFESWKWGREDHDLVKKFEEGLK